MPKNGRNMTLHKLIDHKYVVRTNRASLPLLIAGFLACAVWFVKHGDTRMAFYAIALLTSYMCVAVIEYRHLYRVRRSNKSNSVP